MYKLICIDKTYCWIAPVSTKHQHMAMAIRGAYAVSDEISTPCKIKPLRGN